EPSPLRELVPHSLGPLPSIAQDLGPGSALKSGEVLVGGSSILASNSDKDRQQGRLKEFGGPKQNVHGGAPSPLSHTHTKPTGTTA
ncbi:Hypothetical predicted protein, partial [Pelobates cultripes]